MANKPKYCKHCDSALRIRAEFTLSFNYGGDNYLENCCPLHLRSRLATLKKNYQIIANVTELAQPTPMLWS